MRICIFTSGIKGLIKLFQCIIFNYVQKSNIIKQNQNTLYGVLDSHFTHLNTGLLPLFVYVVLMGGGGVIRKCLVGVCHWGNKTRQPIPEHFQLHIVTLF